MNGKVKCEALKKIRKDIATENGIKLEIPECTHEGDCPGTCPRCESEVRYLERALEARRRKGLKVAIVGVSAGLVAVNAASCNPFDNLTAGNMQVLEGDVPYIAETSDETGSICEETVSTEELTGELAETEKYVLEGDIAFVPDIAGGIGPGPDYEGEGLPEADCEDSSK